MKMRFIVPRHISILTITLILLTTGIASADPKNKGKSFGHKKEPVSVGGTGKEKLTGPNPGRKPVDVTVEYAKTIKDKLKVSDEDLSNLKVKDQYTDTHNGLTHLYLRQQIDGREVIDSDLASHLTRDGEIISISSTLVSGTQGAIGNNPTISPVDAATAAAVDLGLTITEPLQVLETIGGPEQETILTTGGIATEPIRAKLVYQPVAVDEVRLAWNVDIDMIGGEHYWQIRVDATSAAVLAGDDLVDQDNWDRIMPDVSRNRIMSRAHAEALRPSVQASVNDGSGYNVFPIPLESPSDGPRSFVTNPAESVASPHGWHDTNGAAGAEFTITRGNNVHAYTDIDANNVPDPGSSPDGGAGLQFDFAYDPSLPPSANRPPAVVNLFYWNNIVHDVFYKYGFTEASGNFQINNYGRGHVNPTTGLPEGQNDDVRAEAQDGSGTNNANFFTPVDGQRPRMQMFVWNYPFPNLVIVNAPSPIAGSYIATAATFGPAVTLTGFNGDVVLAIDDAEPTSDGCSAFTNAAAVAGKIALVDRGNCNFSVKVHNAQLAGAIGVIVGNNVPGNPITMGFTPPIPTITIPSVMVSLDAANQFKANLPFNAVVRRNPAPSRDSDFDAGVIAHEYGHGISNRLTGGRTIVNCLNNQEQMGEGWSDWLGLVLTTDPSDTAATVRGIGTYVTFQPPDGRGIRPTPYTADMAVNPSTYDTIKTAAVPHGVGYVWATMLWDMYWNLVQKHGYNSNVYEPWNTGGNNLAIQLVMDGMKLQPCRPGFVDGRNAILAADVALTGGANQCEIWRAFVKRGLGLNAVQGASSSVADGTQDFTKYDSAPPVISNVSTNPAVLWPPNHQMVTVPVSYDVTDTCPGVVTTLSVTSNEPQLSNEQGDIAGDYEVVDNHTVRLRAERLGSGTGRVYTITITATDPDGNSSSTTTTVTAPHDQRR